MNELDRMRKLAGILTEGVMAVPGVGQESNEIDEMFDKLSEELDPSEESLIHRYMAGELSREEFMQEMDSIAATDHSMRQGEMGMQGDDTPQGNRAWGREQNDWAGIDDQEDELDDVEMGEAAPMDEKAPPGMEDMVMKLKKQYPGHEEKAFATAWSIYNKKHGKTEENVGMDEESVSAGPDDATVQQAVARIKQMMDSFVSPMEAIDTLIDELTNEGHDDDTIAQIIDSVEKAISNDDDSDSDEGGICPACNGSGEGRYDGSSCSSCGGSGEQRGEGDPDDFNEPDEYDDGNSFYGGLEEEVPMQSKLDDALDALIQSMQTGAQDAESEAQWVAKTHNVDPRALAHAYAQYKAEELGRSGMMEEVEEEDKEEVEEAFDLNNGYDDIQFMAPGDFFPDGADGPVTGSTGPSGARMGDNDEQKKTAVAETHKELVYNYRKFLKESAKK